jgi:hypothetical protein
MSLSEYQYHNCYAMLEEIRTDFNEYSAAFCQGTDTSGVYDNTDIVRKINASQKFIFNLLFQSMPELFLTSSDVTGSSGVYTIPSDVHKMDSIFDADGVQIHPINIQEKHLTSRTGSDYLYYRKGNTIVRDSGISDALTFNYYTTVKDLTQGMSSAGASGSLTLATTAKPIADYYNNIIIENITDGWASTITDYTAARVATLTGTGAASKYYGTVSQLPDIFHPLISERATILLKNTVVSPQRPEAGELVDFKEHLVETIKSFAGSQADISIDELINDFSF